MEVALTPDHAIALQPGQESETLSPKAKKKERKEKKSPVFHIIRETSHFAPLENLLTLIFTFAFTRFSLFVLQNPQAFEYQMK